MKQYIVFGGYSYYASGGWFDFIEDFDSAEEAVEFAEKILNTSIKRPMDENQVDIDFSHVVDTAEKTVIREFGYNYA